MDHKRLPRHEKACKLNPENSIAALDEPVEISESNIALIEKLPKQLKRNRSVTYVCNSCQKKVVIGSYLEFVSISTCPQCERAKTCQQRYGGKAPACSKETVNKMLTTRALSGIEGVEKANAKRKETCLQKYGVEVVSQNKEVRAKQIATLTSKTLKEKISIQEKRKATCQRLYGENYQKVFLEKRKRTSEDRFGARNVFCTDAFQEKRKQTLIDRYGIPHPLKGTYSYDRERFDSKWELALWIYAKDHGEEIEREPTYFKVPFEGKEYGYTPDFRYKGKLIEIKGSQFFKADGTLQNPYDHSQDAKYEAGHQFAISQGIEYWTYENVKFAIDYVEQKYTKDYMELFKYNLPFPYPALNGKVKDDLNIIRSFHKSIYEATRKGTPSPLAAWQNKELVKITALNRLKYVGRCTPESIVQGFNVAKIAPKVSVFKPTRAKKLIEKYLKDCSTVVDPFSGFSGRLIGAYRLGKSYKGFDINEKHVAESNEIIKYLNISNATVLEENLLTVAEKQFDSDTGLFTCPPYGGKEHWNENNDEVEKTCDEWIDLCLSKYKSCKRYLFVVDKTEKYKDDIVEEIVNKSHFGKNREFVVLIEG